MGTLGQRVVTVKVKVEEEELVLRSLRNREAA